METKRFILIIALSLTGLMLWQEWQQDYGEGRVSATDAKEVTSLSVPDTQENAQIPASTPAEDSIVLPEKPAIASSQASTEAVNNQNIAQDSSGYITARTDVYQLKIDLLGGTISQAELLQYPLDKRVSDAPVVLLRPQDPNFHVMQSGLLGEELPNHGDYYRSEQQEYDLGDADQLHIDMYWEGDGIKVQRRLLLQRGSYLIGVEYTVENSTDKTLNTSVYGQLQRSTPQERSSYFIYTYTGTVFSSPEDRYRKVDFDDIRKAPVTMDTPNGWVAMLQHYFVAALLPDRTDNTWRYYGKYLPQTNNYTIGAVSSPLTIAPVSTTRLQYRFYLGPKIQKDLRMVADGLDLTVDYGFLWFIGKILFWVLDKLYSLTGNWGWAIILLTVLVKLVFYPLSAAGYRSMANMRRVQPRIMAIRDRYKDDRQRLNQAMMDIYKTEKINPLGGCFPILVQIPVFIALYWVLLESVELRQAEFMLWLDNISVPDPWFILPLLMGITMYIQQKLNPAPIDPIQEKVFAILPIVFTVFFAFFPAGLVLYWVVNNVLSILQQWFITRSLEASVKKQSG